MKAKILSIYTKVGYSDPGVSVKLNRFDSITVESA